MSLWGRYDAHSRQSIVLGVVCPIVLIALLHSEGVFRDDRRAWIYLCVASFVGFALLALVRGHTGRFQLWVRSIEALIMVPVIGTSSDHPGVQLCCSIGPALVLVSAATVLSGPEVGFLLVASALSILVWLGPNGGDLASVLATGIGASILSGTPAFMLLSYRRRLEAALAAADTMAKTDSLTGLLNRHGLLEAVRQLVSIARATGAIVGVLMVDLDHFKRVNDEYGHLAGDNILQQVAQALRAVVREGDVVARFGGEEICVVLLCRRVDDLLDMGERLRGAVAELSCTPSMTASVGGACARPDADQEAGAMVIHLIGRADANLYEAKRAGRNAVRVLAL